MGDPSGRQAWVSFTTHPCFYPLAELALVEVEVLALVSDLALVEVEVEVEVLTLVVDGGVGRRARARACLRASRPREPASEKKTLR